MDNATFNLIYNAMIETLLMVFVSGLISIVLGVLLGFVVFITRPNHIYSNKIIHAALSSIINIGRSIPFIILLVAIVPLTRFIVGTSIGTSAAIVPLTIGAIPFVARLSEALFSEMPHELIKASQAFGASKLQIIFYIIIPESISGIINIATITLITLVNYSAMAGTIGGGGLGDIAIRYGYQRFDLTIMIITVCLIIILVQIIQYLGDYFSKTFIDKRIQKQ